MFDPALHHVMHSTDPIGPSGGWPRRIVVGTPEDRRVRVIEPATVTDPSVLVPGAVRLVPLLDRLPDYDEMTGTDYPEPAAVADDDVVTPPEQRRKRR